MAYQNFLIAPYESGMQDNVKPWLLPEDSFESLENAYITKEGYVQKKKGTWLKGRLARAVTATSIATGSGSGPYTVTITTPVTPGSVDIYDNSVKQTSDNGTGSITAAGTVTAGTINYRTGALSVTFNHTPTTPQVYYYYYPLEPVMGIALREQAAINQEITVIFDKTGAYEWDSTNKWFASTNTSGHTWSGNDYQFFWTTNFYNTGGYKIFWATNGKAYNGSNVDGIKYYHYDSGWKWATMRAPLDTPSSPTTYLEGCKILLPFKSRLIALVTKEGSTTYSQRARWCQIGNPVYDASTNADAWRSDAIGYGGYIDAATDEHIVSASYIGEDLIIYFEKSVWKLAYTGIKEQPFIFRKISDEFGCESQFSTVLLKGNLIAIGGKAITACNGQQVERIDQKLPTAALNIRNDTQGKERVHGVRDYRNDLIYWTYPVDGSTYPEKLLVYNTENGAYSYFNDGFTALGTFRDTTGDTWGNISKTWSDMANTWASLNYKEESRLILGGNQQGFVSRIGGDLGVNDASLHVTNATVSANQLTITSTAHNLKKGDWVRFANLSGLSGYSTTTSYEVITRTDANTIVVDMGVTLTGAYTGRGTMAKMDNFEIITKKFNPFVKEGSQLKIGYVDLFLAATDSGEINVDVIVDDIASTPTKPVKTISDLSTARHYGPTDATKYWQRINVNSRGQFLQFKFSLNDTQFETDAVLKSIFELHGMNLWLTKSGKWIGLK